MNKCKYCGRTLNFTHEINNVCYACMGKAQDGDMMLLSEDDLNKGLDEMKSYSEMTAQEKLEKYAKHLAKQYALYTDYQYNGKNGANSDNEKGFWRGMANSVLAILQDLKKANLINYTGLYGDNWPKEDNNGNLT
jgi:hypothetical protein